MSLQPFEHYAQAASNEADARWDSRMKFFAIGFALAGVSVGILALGQIGYAVLGALVGAVIGYGIFRAVVYASASASADQLYRTDWCAERGMRFIGDDFFPPDAPYANSGDKQKATDAYEGEWNGFATLFYNFTYTEEGGSDDPDTDYDFQIMRLTGRELPIARLTIHQRSFINRFKWADSLQAKLTKEKSISLESADFNEKFDLTIDDDADEIWIRRIFDPATIQSLIDGSFTIPDVRYYNHAWWFVYDGHFKTRELEDWIPRQKLAADAALHLSRVQTL